MNNINYDEISKIYDDVRDGSIDVIKSFLEETKLGENTRVLDIGCGTGNFTNLLQHITKACVSGADQSAGMLEKARLKNPDIQFTQADACDLPYEDDSFDFVYMTDVIHHIPDVGKLFEEIYRILKSGGKVCISTQSHEQIDGRFFNEYFPGTAIAEKKRYPDIASIVANGEKSGLRLFKQKVLQDDADYVIDKSFLELVEKKGFSMFYLISDEEYRQGLERLRADLKKGSMLKRYSGETQVWFIK